MRASLATYKAAIIIALLVSLGIFVIVLHQSDLRGQDTKTQDSFYSINDKLYSYTSDKQQAPASLMEAGIHAPATISYKKLSDASYRLCAAYKTNYVVSKKSGLDCQTSKVTLNPAQAVSQPFTKNADGSYTVCGVHTNYFDGEGHVLQGPPTTPGSISISSTANPYTGARLLFIISPSSQFFDERCDHLTAANIQVGNTLAVFDITSPNTSATSIFLKRSY